LASACNHLQKILHNAASARTDLDDAGDPIDCLAGRRAEGAD